MIDVVVFCKVVGLWVCVGFGEVDVVVGIVVGVYCFDCFCYVGFVEVEDLECVCVFVI